MPVNSNNDSNYRTVQGFIFKGPFERDAAGKKVRDIYVSATFPEGDVVVKITVWPSHEDVELKVGDYVFVNGQFESSKIQGEDGEDVVRHSLSSYKLINIGNGTGTWQDRGVANVKEAPSGKRVPKGIDF